MTGDNETTGRCLCGAVTYRFTGRPKWQGHCHCESCRRQTSSALASFIGVHADSFAWTGAEPRAFASSPGVIRRFCATCGTPMSYEADRFPGEVHLYAASLDDPAAYRPRFHVFVAEQVPWLELADGLVRHEGVSSG